MREDFAVVPGGPSGPSGQSPAPRNYDIPAFSRTAASLVRGVLSLWSHSLAAMVLNVVLRFVPTSVKAAIAATAINAAINAYSIAVTPDSFFTKFERSLRNGFLLVSKNNPQAATRQLSKSKKLGIF
jgi:hypothetical protein